MMIHVLLIIKRKRKRLHGNKVIKEGLCCTLVKISPFEIVNFECKILRKKSVRKKKTGTRVMLN